jgi:hypothetical protein
MSRVRTLQHDGRPVVEQPQVPCLRAFQAIVGLAATKEEFACALAIDLDEGHRVAFLIRDRAPASVVATIRTIESVADRYRSGASPCLPIRVHS